LSAAAFRAAAGRVGSFFVGRQFDQPRVHLLFLAIALHRERNVAARRRAGDVIAQRVGIVHAGAVHRRDDVTLLDPRLFRRTAGVHRTDQNSPDIFQVEALSQLRGDLLNAHAQLAAADLAILGQLVHDVAGHVRGDGESNPDIAAGGRKNLAVDPDQLALRVHQRAAGVALIDGRVGLQKVLEAAVAQTGLAALGADDAHGHRLSESERIAYRQADIADADLVRIAQRKHRQAGGLDFQQSQVAGRVGTNQLGGKGAPVAQIHGDLFRAVDYVMIGDDVSVGGDDHAGPERVFHLLRIIPRQVAVRVPKKLAEQGVVGKRKLLGRPHPARRMNGHHCRGDAVHHVRVGLLGKSGGASRGRLRRGCGGRSRQGGECVDQQRACSRDEKQHRNRTELDTLHNFSFDRGTLKSVVLPTPLLPSSASTTNKGLA